MTTPSRLRVAHVVRSDAFAGVERYITYVAPELARRSIDVLVIGGDQQAMAKALAPLGIPHYPAATTLDAARQLVRCRPLSLVHTHMSAAEAAALLTQPFTRAPFVTTRHFAARRGRSLAGRFAAMAVERTVRCEIAISRFVAESIGRDSVLLPNGVPPKPAVTARHSVVLMAQRLEEEKDVDVGLRAWAHSGLGNSGWRLRIAGEGSQADELKALTEQLGLAASVDFLGRQSGLDELLASARIFLSTARAEPFGLSVVEAMAVALPVVASASGAHLETVGACAGASLFPAGDPLACADRLRQLAADADLRTRYGSALQALQRERFDLEAHVAALATLYREIMGDAVDEEPGGGTDPFDRSQPRGSRPMLRKLFSRVRDPRRASGGRPHRTS